MRKSLTAGRKCAPYTIRIPYGIDNHHIVPLVIALHGGQGSAEKWPAYTDKGFERLADREHFILVYPNGGMMAHRLAAVHSDKVAAFASVIASIPTNLEGELQPAQAVSVLMINGTEDPLVRWQGGPVKFGRKVNGDLISIDRTVSFWATHDKCAAKPETTNLPDRAPDDGTLVERIRYSDCRSNTEVVMYRVVGGRHTWPMYREIRGKIATKLLDRLVGRRSRDIDACEVIWAFFKEQPKRRTGRS